MIIQYWINSTTGHLAIAIISGVALGFGNSMSTCFLKVITEKGLLVDKQITNQIIYFMMPFIIIRCIEPSISCFKGNAPKLLFMTKMLLSTSLRFRFLHIWKPELHTEDNELRTQLLISYKIPDLKLMPYLANVIFTWGSLFTTLPVLTISLTICKQKPSICSLSETKIHCIS